ncbi:MAG: acyl-CoA dehydrogenase family protein [Chloroflexi bacterium]|nr:acyl-CoA dehydrogenase family protein [Chloroflexota bacterium]
MRGSRAVPEAAAAGRNAGGGTMDFHFSEEEERFRRELRDFLAGRLPADWRDRSFLLAQDAPERDELGGALARELGERRWLALAWPERYGGSGASYLQQAVYSEELAYQAAPTNSAAGVQWVGPAIMRFGDEAQRERYLPSIARGEESWCTLYSEPGAGSDLAAIQTRAVRDGDEWVINGQKLWAAGAGRATLGWLAARTDPAAPKHRGISTFVVPMDTPGITMRPIEDITGARTLNEVYLENVRIPADHLVGEENRGWYQVAQTLDMERSGVGTFASGRRNVEKLVEIAKARHDLMAQRPSSRYELADRWIELEVGYQVAYRIPYLQQQGATPNYEASVSKLFGAELTQRIAQTGVQLLGTAGQIAPGPASGAEAPLQGALSRNYLAAVASTIASGTSEVQRGVIARRGLGLPR